MHAATLESGRLQKVYFALLSGPKTTWELIQITGCCAISSIISELRSNGIDIICTCIRKGVYQYSLAK